jgi:hypothetical protein
MWLHPVSKRLTDPQHWNKALKDIGQFQVPLDQTDVRHETSSKAS